MHILPPTCEFWCFPSFMPSLLLYALGTIVCYVEFELKSYIKARVKVLFIYLSAVPWSPLLSCNNTICTLRSQHNIYTTTADLGPPKAPVTSLHSHTHNLLAAVHCHDRRHHIMQEWELAHVLSKMHFFYVRVCMPSLLQC